MHHVTFVFKLQTLVWGALQMSGIDELVEKKANRFCWIKQEIKFTVYKKHKVYEGHWFFQSARLWFALFLYSAVCFLVGNTPHLRGGKAESSCLSFCATFADVKWKLNNPGKLKFLAKESVRCGEMVWNQTDNFKLLFENLAGQGLCKNFLHVWSDKPQSVNFSKWLV